MQMHTANYLFLLAILFSISCPGCDRTANLRELGSKDPNIRITWAGRKVVSLSVNGDKSLQRVLPLLENSIHIDQIFIQFCNLQSAHFRSLSGLRTLTKIKIFGGTISDQKDLVELRKLPKLSLLQLGVGKLQNDVFEYLDSLKNLRDLDLDGNQITSITGLAKINLPELLHLSVASNPIDDEGFNDIVLLPRLEYIHILDTPITVEGCKQAASLLKLRSFSMPNMSIAKQREVKAAFDEARRDAQSKSIEILPEKEYPFAYLESGFFKDRKE